MRTRGVRRGQVRKAGSEGFRDSAVRRAMRMVRTGSRVFPDEPREVRHPRGACLIESSLVVFANPNAGRRRKEIRRRSGVTGGDENEYQD